MSNRFNLSELEGAAVQGVLDRLSARAGYRLSLNSFVNVWATFVAEVDRGYRESIYDYTNSLGVRDLIDEVFANIPKSAGDIILKVIHPIDERFEKTTNSSIGLFCYSPSRGAPWISSAWG